MLSVYIPTLRKDVKIQMTLTTREDPILARYQQRYSKLRKLLAEIAYFCKGTVLSRTLKCGRPTCPCATNPKSRHGHTSSGPTRWPARRYTTG